MIKPFAQALAIVVALFVATEARAQTTTAVTGVVTRQDGTPLGGVMVLLQEAQDVEWTTPDGRYRFGRVKPGTYTILLTLGEYSTAETVTITAGATPRTVETKVDWPLSFVETMVVQAASKQIESIADAPAAVTTIDARDIARQSTHGQLPLLLAAGAGVQVAQSGLYDFNVNARGFNDLVNRRVRTEIDGRETSLPHVMGYTDWATLPMALGEYEQIEFVRGPGGALYGMGALNGILSLRSKDPASSLGGKARLTIGELNTQRIEFRHAGGFGRGWYFKGVGAYQQSDDFAVSRVGRVEYAPGRLLPEIVPPALDRSRLTFISGRVDKHFAGGDVLAIEGGTTEKEGPITLTNLGRYQATDASFPWARAQLTAARWRVLAAITTADINDQLGLSTGAGSFQSGFNLQLDAQTNGVLRGGRGRWIAGAAFGRQRVDSADRGGAQTIFDRPESARTGAVFGQVDYGVTDRLRASFAARVDATTLARTTFSPRAAVVYEIATGQRVRAAFSDAFKSPTLAETRLRAPIAPPLDLSALEAALASVLGATRLGFANIPLLAVGNEHLDVEEVRSFELGYSGVVAKRTFVQATWYRNHNTTFTSGLLPQVGTSLGRLNPTFGPYRPPSALSPSAAAVVEASLAAALPPSLAGSLSNLADGRPVFAVLSLGNFGAADTEGLELSSMTMLPRGWRLDANYAWFDFSLESDVPEAQLRPNTPSHQGGLGLVYISSRFDAGGRLRWVDAFDWVSGLYVGPVPSYTVVDVQANVPITDRLTVGVDVANLFDNVHYEMFGGDLLRRRALAHVTVSW